MHEMPIAKLATALSGEEGEGEEWSDDSGGEEDVGVPEAAVDDALAAMRAAMAAEPAEQEEPEREREPPGQRRRRHRHAPW